MIYLIAYALAILAMFTVLGFSASEMGMWPALGLSLVWPITLYWVLLDVISKVIPWKV